MADRRFRRWRGRSSAPTGPLRWWRRRGIRARLALTSAAALALTLVGLARLFAFAVGHSMVATLDDSARRSASDVVTLIDANRLPDPILTTGGTMTIQVVDATGRIRAASPGADRLVPLLDARTLAAARRDRRARFLDGRGYGMPDVLRVVALPARDGRTVIAATSYEQVRHGVESVTRILAIGTPILLVLLGTAGWLVIGGALRPITELRRGAEEISGTSRSRRLPLPEARDEVHDLAVTLNDMLHRLERAEARQRALVSDTAHELRSPLASIRAQLEVALDHPDGQHWPETAAGVLADTLRLSRLADDLLVLARLDEHGARSAAREPVDLAALARVAGERHPAARITVTVDAGEPVIVHGDGKGLTRLLDNLVDNALRHAATGVRVRVSGDAEWAELSVSDDGPGIPPADRERVFARFTRLDEGRSRDEGGAGLGLAIVRETARVHGGDAHLEDASPGLRAVVRLPLPRPSGE
ncbi:HAMP domain-containing histidine kinase [Actinoallomurus purpureus]|uniref:sensor histidine kinase n=1 Tax=Actinoallomurus purpureus TaxID=478114 RepID=UPI00209384C5|nr:ATP-binding protein [Actinoallomurus purpureus]MCO6011182.1 HAMP domain-containing histidine kinase [Actinoallomurus purpureus]